MRKRSYATLLNTMVFMLGGNPRLVEGSTSDGCAGDLGSEIPTATDSQQDRSITSRIQQNLVGNKLLSIGVTTK